MDASNNPISNEEATEIKSSGDEGKVDSGGVLEPVPPPLESVVKPFVEEFTQVAKSMVQNVTQSSSSYVTEMEKEVEKSVRESDPWTSLKNLIPTPESSMKVSESTLPTSDENVGESSEEAVKSTPAEAKEACLDENPRTTHTQPFVAVAATSRASWMNCCGLLDVLRPSDH